MLFVLTNISNVMPKKRVEYLCNVHMKLAFCRIMVKKTENFPIDKHRKYGIIV